MNSKLQVNSTFDPAGELIRISTEYSSLLKANGIDIHSDPQKIMTEFNRLSEDLQKKFLSRLRFSYENSLQAVAENYSLLRDKRFVWRTLRNLEAVPPSDLLDHLDENDYIEIYDSDGIQRFANFEFCRLISYTIEETTFYPWNELYSRDSEITDQIMGAVVQCFQKENGPFIPNIEEHEGRELKSGSGRIFNVKMKMFSPILNKNGQKQFLIATSSISRIS